MKKLMLLLAIFLIATSSAWAYDKMMAQSYAEQFEPVSGKTTGKSLHMMKTADFVKAVKAGKIYVLDIRTPEEAGFYGVTIPGSVVMPLNQVFKAENLALLPTDKKIVIVCKSGRRSIVISSALRHIGFDNAYTLKFGIIDLVKYLTPKTAY